MTSALAPLPDPRQAATLPRGRRTVPLHIVVGETQAGTTTRLNCLAVIPGGRERVITCEEVSELTNVKS